MPAIVNENGLLAFPHNHRQKDYRIILSSSYTRWIFDISYVLLLRPDPAFDLMAAAFLR